MLLRETHEPAQFAGDEVLVDTTLEARPFYGWDCVGAAMGPDLEPAPHPEHGPSAAPIVAATIGNIAECPVLSPGVPGVAAHGEAGRTGTMEAGHVRTENEHFIRGQSCYHRHFEVTG